MLYLYNTMTRSKQVFKPRTKGAVKIFTCGPSIYRRPHIGNYRTFMYEDILVKYLEYCGYQVDRAIPLTDIEDKTILEAKKKNRKIADLTGDVEKIFFSEAKALNILLPKKVQRTSACVPCAASMILRLIREGCAYRYGVDIFFDPLKFADFGKLYRLDMSTWPKKKVRFKRDTYNGNRWNRGDFILWHGYREGDISWWDTEIGKGRPSWNIQDPSVIVQYLGPQIDINCGGIDNIFRHHDYNIAIMESYTGKEYARFYMHGGHLIVEGKPMSKSRGNILYPEDMFKQGCKARDLRFFLFYTHYKKKLNFTKNRFKSACEKLETMRTTTRKLVSASGTAIKTNMRVSELITRMRQNFEAAMNDDLSIGNAFDAVFESMCELDVLKNTMSRKDSIALERVLRNIDSVLGVIF